MSIEGATYEAACTDGCAGLVILPEIGQPEWDIVTINGSPVSTNNSLMLEAGTYNITARYDNEKI